MVSSDNPKYIKLSTMATMSPVKRFFNSRVVWGVGGILLLIKFWLKVTTGHCRSEARLEGRTVVITGANSGIGLETAKELARRGARLVMVCRDLKKAHIARRMITSQTGSSDITVKGIDFCSLASVRKCAKEILAEEDNIHILLNNAGCASGSFTKTSDNLDNLMQANHFGPFLFTNLLLETIQKSAPSRIINVSSETHRMAKLDLEHLDLTNTKSEIVAYANSKLCNVMMANHLASKLKGKGVTVNSLTPGVVVTDILRDASYLTRVVSNTVNGIFCKTLKEGAQTSIFACVDPRLGDITGKYFMDCMETKASAEACDAAKAKKLWTLSEHAVGLQPNERMF